ncbi:MAG: excinuclease ABC subunit UvrB [Acidobacteriota bacterium]
MEEFKLHSKFKPMGDQPSAINSLVRGIKEGKRDQVLLGVTGSGKTFTMAKVIEKVKRPTIVIAHNKTLAAQLYQEFRSFFPDNAVEYFVSYYDYYQPEAYIPQTDTYIEKDSSINDDIDRMRHSATRSLFERRDVLIVASVSCIYGLGSPEAYHGMLLLLEEGKEMDRHEMIKKLVEIQYTRTNADLLRGTFRARGDILEIFPSYEEKSIRVELFGDKIESIAMVDPLRRIVLEKARRVPVYPNSHYVTPEGQLRDAIRSIREELEQRLHELEAQRKLLEAQRLKQRTLFDLEMIQEIGYCSGIENYSRHLTGRSPGQPPPTLIDYLPDDALIFIDESHQTVPQLKGMYRGDRSRKETLVEYGFRLPSALDNRPLMFEEFEEMRGRTIFVSATPGPYELSKTEGEFSEQVIRPTGLVDPQVEVKPVMNQADDLLAEIRERTKIGDRVLVTTLTKRMAEDLTEYYRQLGVKAKYLHSDIETLERVKILTDLRKGTFDVLIGVNLLREGLDLPEVSLVAILDADKEGFLRSAGSLIQTSGRAARNVRGKVIMYADLMTQSMGRAIAEMRRRREIQQGYNKKHKITPETIVKAIDESVWQICDADYMTVPKQLETIEEFKTIEEIDREIRRLEKEMSRSAEALEFERAAELRDRIRYLKKKILFS